MSFYHPWAVSLGLAAVALPLLIHWLTRPRPLRMPLSTIRFVREAVQQRRSRNRLRDWLTLTLRMLAVLLLAFAIARPLMQADASLASADTSGTLRLVILDVSQSMAAQDNGVQLFERAKPKAAGFLDNTPGVQANLILAGARPHPVFDRLSTNFSALRKELSNAKVRPERLHIQAAIEMSAELFVKAGGDVNRKRELIIVSDFQRSNWTAVDFSSLPKNATIKLESVAPREPLANLAILDVRNRGRPEQGRPVYLEVEVGNFSTTPQDVQVEVSLGQTIHILKGNCSPESKTVLTTQLLLRDAGWKTGHARLMDVQDALPQDDTRPLVLEVRPTPRYALITRQPEDLRPSSSYFVERALSPFAPHPTRKQPRVTRFDPKLLDADALGKFDVIVLDHPGELTKPAVKLLSGLFHRGRGVLYVASEPQDAINLQSLSRAAGNDLQLPVEFSPPPFDRQRHNLFLIRVRQERPPFRIFGDGLSKLTHPLRFAGGLTSRRLDNALADEILATYSDGSACLVVTECGAGTLAVLNVDVMASNLPSSPLFVPLIGELCQHLLRTRSKMNAVFSGEPLTAYLPLSAGPIGQLKIVHPKGESPGQISEESGGILWRSSSSGVPGIYTVQRNSEIVYGLATVVPSEESNLRSLDRDILQGRLAGQYAVEYRSAHGDSGRHDDMWVWLALGCILCLLGEVLVLRIFRS